MDHFVLSSVMLFSLGYNYKFTSREKKEGVPPWNEINFVSLENQVLYEQLFHQFKKKFVRLFYYSSPAINYCVYL